jgi:hypothetical protein
MKNNVKEHTASPEDTQNNQTDGGGLDVSSCSASSFDLDKELEICRATNAILRESNKRFRETGGKYEPIDWEPLKALGVEIPSPFPSR